MPGSDEAGILVDLEDALARIAPPAADYKHHLRGVDDNGRAHVLSALLNRNVSVPIIDHQLALGTWQGIYLWEHRTAPHTRQVTVTIVGE